MRVRRPASRAAGMCDAVLVDLTRACSLACAGAGQLADPESAPRAFILCGKRSRASCSFLQGRAHVLDRGSTVERLYRFKQALDGLGLSSVRVLTTAGGKQVLLAYQEQLFTQVYRFQYQLSPDGGSSCPSCRDSAHTDAAEDGRQAEEVSAFLQTLPGLKGSVRVLQSSLVPGEVAGAPGSGVSGLRPLKLLLCCRRLRPRLQHACGGRVLRPHPLRPQPVQQPEEAGPLRRGAGEPAAPGPPRRLPPAPSSAS